MTGQKNRQAWSVPVLLADISESGQHFDLVPDAETRAALARAAGVVAIPRLDVSFDVTPQGRGAHVVGSVSADVDQTCVVTLEPVRNTVNESVDLTFAPLDATAEAAAEAMEPESAGELPEPLIDGTINLGAIASEFLLLGIDPYPRKPGAVFTPPAAGDESAHPFAALAALKKEKKSN